MNDEQLLRYSRHILLDEVGIEGQQRILDARVLIIGAGGLGCPAAMYLASSGVGEITLVDHDTVDLSNLQRQIGHTTERVGLPKVDSLASALRDINPNLMVRTIQQRADASLLDQEVPRATVVLDCCDNYVTRQAINTACVKHHIPLVSAAIIRFDGQLQVFDLRQEKSPCYACIFPPDAQFEEVQCSSMGVFAPLVGIMGSMQSAEALKLISGAGNAMTHKLLMLDGISMEWSQMRTSLNTECKVCS